MTFTPKPFQAPAPRIEQADVPLATLQQIVDRQKADARAEQSAEKLRRLLAEPPASRPCSAGETAEQHHWLYDDDPDSTVSAFPYPNALEAS